MDDSSYADLQGFLANNPEAGSVIPGSGGIRKIRWTGSGRGKRGGSRILYYLWTDERILMLFAYLKNELENLTPDQLRQLKAAVLENLK
jgi:mRNA-degrading endonuclease RelE of RelBE toxin-antitoxin system